MANITGPHDVGGRRGYGQILVEPEEGAPARWEGRVIGLTFSAGLAGLLQTADHWRAWIEGLPPIAYARMSYFERWLYTLERNLVHKGILTEEEIDERLQEIADDPGAGRVPRVAPSDSEAISALESLMRTARPPTFEAPSPPRFAPGETVRIRVIRIEHPGEQHTRLPGYAQGHSGTVVRLLPVQGLPDLMVERKELRPEHTYSVRLATADLWPDGESNTSVCVDAWESYLEPAE